MAILSIAVAAIFFKEELLQWPTPFMINNALYWFSFFAIGYLAGKPLIRLMTDKKRKILILTGSITFVFLCVAFQESGLPDFHEFVEHSKNIVFIMAFLSFFALFDGLANVEILRFFGKNSLAVLGAHLWILIPLSRIMFKLTGIHHPWIGFGIAVATAIILIPAINLMNKKIPYLVGK